MERNITQVMVIPEVPNVIPNQELYVYVPQATNSEKGIATFDETSLSVESGKVSVKEDFVKNLIFGDVRFSDKQDKNDPNIKSEADKPNTNVVEAINRNTDFRLGYKSRIETNEQDIDELDKQIQDLKDASISGVTWAGTIEINRAPSYNGVTYPAEDLALLNNAVKQVFGESAIPQSGYYVKWKYVNDVDNTIVVYIITYTDKWNKPDLQAPIQEAQNDNFGVIKGSETSDGVKIDIVNGEIRRIYNKKDSVQLGDFMNGVISGDQIVGKSKEAISAQTDANGTPIVDYALQENVYNKEQSDSRFLPISYNTIFYYSKNGLVDTLPVGQDPEFTVNIAGIHNETLVFDIKQVTDHLFTFNKNSSDVSNFYFVTNKDVTLKFRLVTNGIKSNVETALARDVSLNIPFQANVFTEVTFNTIYNELVDKYELKSGDILQKKLYVEVLRMDGTDAVTLQMYCNSTYQSTFQLSVKSTLVTYNAITKPKRIFISKTDFVKKNNGYEVDIPAYLHEQPLGEYMVNTYIKNDNNVECVSLQYSINTETGVITLYSAYPLDCILLIAFGEGRVVKQSVHLKDPNTLSDVNLDNVGSIIIQQTIAPTALTLPSPENASDTYKLYIVNSNDSTNNVTVNNRTIEPSKSLHFVWVGQWTIVSAVVNTDDVLYEPTGISLTEELETIRNSVEKNKTDNIANANSIKRLEQSQGGGSVTFENIYDGRTLVGQKSYIITVDLPTDKTAFILGYASVDGIVYSGDAAMNIYIGWAPTFNGEQNGTPYHTSVVLTKQINRATVPIMIGPVSNSNAIRVEIAEQSPRDVSFDAKLVLFMITA